MFFSHATVNKSLTLTMSPSGLLWWVSDRA